MTKKILKAVYGSQYTTLPFGDMKIPCYVLDDGTRVLSGRGMQKALGMSPKKAGDKLKKLIESPNIPSFWVPAIQEKFARRIEFLRPGSGGSVPKTYGYEATLLIDICNALIDANKQEILPSNMRIYTEHASIILKSVAKIGIIALIDETTGYQEERAKDALRLLLEKYISEEFRPWQKQFPNIFYEQICQLNKWSLEKAIKRPGVVGRWTDNIIYKRLPEGVLAELRTKNPKIKTGRRYKHHQFLTEDFGNQHLRDILISSIAVMKASPNWKRFMANWNRAYPMIENTQLELFEIHETEEDE